MAALHVVSALRDKRAELHGTVRQLQQQSSNSDIWRISMALVHLAERRRAESDGPRRYAMTRWQRANSGCPAASIRFRTATPMAASVCWAAKQRAGSRGPNSALQRPIVVSTSER